LIMTEERPLVETRLGKQAASRSRGSRSEVQTRAPLGPRSGCSARTFGLCFGGAIGSCPKERERERERGKGEGKVKVKPAASDEKETNKGQKQQQQSASTIFSSYSNRHTDTRPSQWGPNRSGQTANQTRAQRCPATLTLPFPLTLLLQLTDDVLCAPKRNHMAQNGTKWHQMEPTGIH